MAGDEPAGRQQSMARNNPIVSHPPLSLNLTCGCDTCGIVLSCQAWQELRAHAGCVWTTYMAEKPPLTISTGAAIALNKGGTPSERFPSHDLVDI